MPPNLSHPSKILVIGGSAGSIEALLHLTKALPTDFPAATLIVIHSGATSVLADILSCATSLPVSWARDRTPLSAGQILVAPPDHHLIVEGGLARIYRGPKENGFRPAIDTLFRSAARAYGSGVIGVVLSGALDCGADGLHMIKALGGRAVVQDPEEALYPEMPRHAIYKASPDAILPVDEIAAAVVAMFARPDTPSPAEAIKEATYRSSELTCPECRGALSEDDSARGAVFRCHVGHTFSMAGFNAEQSRDLEASLWTAVRALRESEALARRMARSGIAGLSQRHEDRAATLHHYSEVITAFLMSPRLMPHETPDDAPAGDLRPRHRNPEADRLRAAKIALSSKSRRRSGGAPRRKKRAGHSRAKARRSRL